MATFPNPKALAAPPAITTDTFKRPISTFDAGINASTAWVAERAEKGASAQSISDDEEDIDTGTGRAARALYDFDGKPEFRELTMSAGDELDILKEELDDGWSLANVDGKVGLIPRTYYAFTSEMIFAPSLLSSEQSQHDRAGSGSSLTPRNSPRAGNAALPLQPQTTGEWYSFPSFRQSLLGGRTLNRFSSFVTTGAEDWVLKGTSADLPTTTAQPASVYINDEEEEEESDKDTQDPELSQPDRHFIEHGPAWKPKSPGFRVMVHSPSKRSSGLSGSYTVYLVTSLFFPAEPQDTSYENMASPTRITVHRRFSHFVFLHTSLTRRLPGIALPPLPEKQYAGRFSQEFVEARRGDLERYLSRVIRHPVARYAEVLTFFLGCESEIEWNRLLPHHLNSPPAGAVFYSQVYHPAFNLDAEDAVETVDRFQRHIKAVDKSVQGLRVIFQKVRGARREMSNIQRLLSYGLLSLITSTPIAGGNPTPGLDDEHEDEDESSHSRKGLMNDEGAWCWREECEGCLNLTKALQKTAETLQSVADLHDDSARRRQLASHETLKDLAHPSELYASVIETHQATLTRYKAAANSEAPDDEVAARCETVLNTTMAEFETYHRQKAEDFERFATEHLDGEIEFYEQILARLRGAREAFNEPQYSTLSSTPRQPSMYERELPNPRLSTRSLPQPCPHVFDSAPMRPVSVAIGGMNLLLGGSTTGVSRASVLGKFW